MVLASLLVLGIAAAADGPTKDSKVEPATVVDGVRSVPNYPVIWPEMPAGPNKDVYLNNCVACHSQYYVLMQPPFSKKVWTAEVEKMKKTYGAMIDDKVMPQIVDYLVSIRGMGK
jgi:cytochrome c5